MLWAAYLITPALILGIILGYYARSMHDWVQGLYEMFKDRIDTPAGVVKPVIRHGASRPQVDPIDLSARDDEAGGVLRPTPMQAEAFKELGERSILAGKRGRRRGGYEIPG